MNVLEDYLEDHFEEVSPRAFYREIFPEGTLQKRGEFEKGVYNGIIVSVTGEKKKDGTPRIKRYTVTDDLEAIDEVCASEDFCLMAPISYAGKSRAAENARFLYAVAVDLDSIRVENGSPVGLRSLWERHIGLTARIPQPTFLVSSGTGLHLYYVLDEPIAMYGETVHQLQQFKYDLTELIWHDTICDIRDKREIQQEGIYQGFRMPGTVTKNGDRVRAFVCGVKLPIDFLNCFIRNKSHWVLPFLHERTCSLAEAKERFPEWYARRVEKKEGSGVWHVNRRLYDWWKRQIYAGATVGHRYFCLMMLAIYAKKCSSYDEKKNPNPVTWEELEKDAWALMEFLDELTVSEENRFTPEDVLQALLAFDDKWITYPRESIAYRSGIPIQPNKRKYQKQADHLEEARMIRDLRMKRAGKKWTDGNGRKSKKDEVLDWLVSHPAGTPSACARELQISRTTVYKYWNLGEKKEKGVPESPLNGS